MANTDNGQIDYRKRVRDRQQRQTAAKLAALAPPEDPYDPPVLSGKQEMVDAAPPHQEAVIQVDVTARTPSDVRALAVSTVAEMLELSNDDYTAAMQELADTDVVLYAAVVDEIENLTATK